MKTRWIDVVWGIVLILAGGLFLAQSLGWIGAQTLSFWVVVFAALSLFFFITYFVNGVQQWGWLFPACTLGGIAITMTLANAGVEDPWIGAPVLIGVALPFLVAFLLERRANWWALIPLWILLLVTAIIFLAEQAPGEWIGTLVMWGIGLPFLVVYLSDRSRWWALIPGGILASLGCMALLGGLEDAGAEADRWANAILFLGIGLTFGVLWLRRKTAPTAWARYPALILLLIGFFALALGQGLQQFLMPVVLIALGAWILWSTLRAKSPSG